MNYLSSIYLKKFILFIFISFSFSIDKIYFVYNANDDLFSIIGDFFHKSFSPKTYSCNLCKLSYGPISKKHIWKDFLNNLEFDYSFVYKNHDNLFLSHIQSYPIILYTKDDDINVLLSKEEINLCKDVEELIFLLNNKIIDIQK